MAGSTSCGLIWSGWLFLWKVIGSLMLLTSYVEVHGVGNPVIAPSPVVTTHLGGTINITCIKPNEAMEVAWETGLLPSISFCDENDLVTTVDDLLLNESFIYCIARLPSQPATLYTSNPVTLLIQGTLGSFELTKMDYGPCAVKVSWNSPFTLAGVPILGYEINVTNQNTGLKNISFTNNTSISLSLDYSYTVAVSGVNSAGVGNSSIINVSSVLNDLYKNFSNLSFSNLIPSRIADKWKTNISLSNYRQQHEEILEDFWCNAFIVIIFTDTNDSTTVFKSKKTYIIDGELSDDPIVMKEHSHYDVTIMLEAFQRQAKVFESANIGKLSTFDVQDINNENGNNCLYTNFVYGSNNSRCGIELFCSNESHVINFTLDGKGQCLNETAKNSTCHLKAYDCANDDCVISSWKGPAVIRNITFNNISSTSEEEAIEESSTTSYVKSTIYPSTTDAISASEMAYPSDTVEATNSIEPHVFSLLIAVIVSTIIITIFIITIMVMVLVIYIKKSNKVKSCSSDDYYAQESYEYKRNYTEQSNENKNDTYL